MQETMRVHFEKLMDGSFPDRVKAIRYFEKTRESAPFLARKLVDVRGPQRGWIVPALRKTIDYETLGYRVADSEKFNDWDLRIKANCLLWEMAEPAIMAVLDTLTNNWDNAAINFSAMLLAKAGRDSYMALIQVLAEDRKNEYFPPENGWEEGCVDREIVAAFAHIMENTVWQNRVKQLWFSCMRGKKGFKSSMPVFIEALKDESLHDMASWVLGNSGGWPVEALRQNLNNSDEKIRSGVEKALVRMYPNLFPELRELLCGKL
ncbi:hypothetical protein COY52_10595 [Candidatus Desantisbacteria bacterium CG_4_10_14_0_8_um_filter_48_22]|uniref:Uncharacterized protein n=1 Tax=Candidatus Desantisbacteria bacterium CG_4_10_14_0_8_um_filter_48_22 TaxID=1974543 RepID=A0A2M7S6G3_9BACT|nr:MAG: hypothetical protein AUJ67_08685 [Candidatus Desantisbacteria bacterium CG1_02_49_89]PIV56649.1 MAG: hypothetical protein COS16_03340 [Candidatus Desantisbacteria bacterium CG02_land_8_20_14_3_00_49_13]PIZ14998.1 MAG: hypothetical protein COY52_10595 [Candidatus Desantisbacteria bacterium CG_4_10_14_0_8_um_filter_48_22]PJB27287.1 MAG: hypothetical protein CO111_06140 [Candidatus Desantisbacteria bacterium CG_4_9_14_3_um_filter_50_7]